MPSTSKRLTAMACVALAWCVGCGATKASDPDGDGGNDTGTTGDDGGGLSQTAACAAYLECATAVIPAELGQLLESYGPEGTCWASTDEVAAQCDQACGNALAQLIAANPDEPACAEPPADDGADEGSDDGNEGGTVTDNAVDLVFIVDNSGSMGEEQGGLSATLSSLVDQLTVDGGPDLRIAVTTTDNGNPWCDGTSPEAGQFVLSSCRARTSDFVFNGAQTIDATQEACLEFCQHEAITADAAWIEAGPGGTNLGGDVPLTEALQCVLPQGINGCGFEQPLQALRLALEGNPGFRRPGALLAIILVTDEADCSTRPEAESIFLPDGDRTFWSLPDEQAPTSAVCWNAGVACSGGQCESVNLDALGLEVAPGEAVMYPVSDYVGLLAGEAVFVSALAGVGADGTAVYQDSLDQAFQDDFGIGPGCSSDAGEAVPPVRVREFVEQVGAGGQLHSICAGDYSASLSTIGNQILSRLP